MDRRKIKDNQLEVLAQNIAAGMTTTDAAAKIPMSLRTAIKYTRTPEFLTRVAEIQDGMLRTVMVDYAKHLTAAAEVLFETLTAEKVERRTKIVAAKAIMDHYLKIRTALETDRLIDGLRVRLSQLEAEKAPRVQGAAA